jgi:hypothetical protein
MVETTCMGAGLSKNILQGFFYLVYKKSWYDRPVTVTP